MVKVALETYTNASQQSGASNGKSEQVGGGLPSVKMVYVPRKSTMRLMNRNR